MGLTKKEMAKISKKLLREIYDMHTAIGMAKNHFLNDRSTERASLVISSLDEAWKIGQKIIDSQDPL